MDVATLRASVAKFPRLVLADYATPLERLERLGQIAHLPCLIKRDDSIGPAMGGNKTRKLEFLMADAQAQGAGKVVTFGGLQSNHARMTAAVSRKLGMEPHLFYFAKRPRELTGNLLLNCLLDAKLHFIPFGAGGRNDLQRVNRLVRILSRLVVGQSYFIPVGGHCALGCLGYVLCAAEIHEQVQALGLRNATVVCAVGTGGTLAGLIGGFALLDSPLKALGIDVGKLWHECPEDIARLAGEICAMLGERRSFESGQVQLIEDRYVGPAYAVPTPEGNAAVRLLAESEGIILDPVYTGKAMAGLIDLAKQDYFTWDEAVIFLHTGGAPALFAFPEAFKKDQTTRNKVH